MHQPSITTSVSCRFFAFESVSVPLLDARLSGWRAYSVRMTSDQPHGASPVLRRIAAVQKFSLRTAFIAGPAWILSPLALGLWVGAGGPQWLYRLVALPAVVFFGGLVLWAVCVDRDRRFRSMRAAAEDVAAERELPATRETPDGSGS